MVGVAVETYPSPFVKVSERRKEKKCRRKLIFSETDSHRCRSRQENMFELWFELASHRHRPSFTLCLPATLCNQVSCGKSRTHISQLLPQQTQCQPRYSRASLVSIPATEREHLDNGEMDRRVTSSSVNLPWFVFVE